jgi:phage shock protein PspC (stress-responsive transcriptional regulator)
MGKRRKIGIVLIVLSIIIFVIDRFSHSISNELRKIICGDQYLKPVNGVTGDVSCGFNADMYLVAFLFVVLVAGGVLFIFSAKKTDNKH